MEIVYAFVGKLPSYIVESIHQARLFSTNKITLICDDLQSPYLDKLSKFNVTIVPYQTVIDTNFITEVNIHIKSFCIVEKLGDRRELFIRSFERFFLLQKYMELSGSTNILFLELDMLIYAKPEEMLPILQEKEASFVYTLKDHTCAAFCYVKSVSILKDINTYFLEFIQNEGEKTFMSEMIALSYWLRKKENYDRVWLLPSLWKDESVSSDIWINYEKFNGCLYDSMGIGVLVDGPDTVHRAEWEQKNRVWWMTEAKYSNYTYTWSIVNGLRTLFLINQDSTQHKVNCIHVHNKNLSVFLSKPLTNDIPKDNFLHGDRFLKMADCILRKKSRNDYYEVKEWSKENILFFEDILSSTETWNNPKTLFCNNDDLSAFLEILPKIQNPFILLSHNGDENVTSKYFPICDTTLLIKWYTQNACISHPKLVILPIGFANPVWAHGNYSQFSQIQSMNIEKINPVYANFLVQTNREAREKCLHACKMFNIPIQNRCPPVIYMQGLASSFFCICPEGNGIDTHRFWESLYLKSIPIILKNPLSEKLAQEFPCILLNEWTDLNNLKLEYNPSFFTDDLMKKIGFQYYESMIKQDIDSQIGR
jgi:hypothetical protein